MHVRDGEVVGPDRRARRPGLEIDRDADVATVEVHEVAGLVGGWGLAPALPGAFGYLYLPALAVIAAASVTMAPLGARAAHAMNVAQLKKAFAALLFALAAYMLWKGVAGL